MKLLSLFSGIGSFEQALKNINVDFELVGFSEIDKHAIKSYCAIHDVDESLNLGSVTDIDIDKLGEIDIIVHGSPCQSVSKAGKNLGADKNSGTTSSLMWRTVEIVKKRRPKFVLWENVPNLLSKKHRHNFNEYLDVLDSMGYSSSYKLLNAKEYGDIPQNRERVFVISILGEHDPYEFPKGFPLKTRLKDILEDEVHDKYYLSDEIQARFKPNKHFQQKSANIVGTTAPELRTIGQRDLCYHDESVMGALVATDYKQPKQLVEEKVQRIGGLFDTDTRTRQAGGVFDKDGLSPTLDTAQGGHRTPSITVVGKLDCEGWHDVETRVNSFDGIGACVETRNRAKYLEEDVNLVIGSTQKNAFIGDGEYSPTLTNAMGSGGGHVPMVGFAQQYRIRKLTPNECWRLMGVKDEHFKKAQEVNSDSQLYKQAGNSIVVDVLYYIFKELFMKDSEQDSECL